MENAIVIAKIASIVYLSIAVGTFLNPSFMKKLLDDFMKSPWLIFLAAWMTLIVWMMIILSYNVRTLHAWLLVTILGWLATIKGISLFIAPQTIMKTSTTFAKQSWRISGCSFVIWILFLYLWFFS